MPENTNMVNRKLLEMMPGGSMLVNTARGELVDEVNILTRHVANVKAEVKVFYVHISIQIWLDAHSRLL